jgi:aminoglycoside 6'-N-acetyltransferase I
MADAGTHEHTMTLLLTIVDLQADDEQAITAAAEVAFAAFAQIDYLDTYEDALAEVHEALEPGVICLAAWNISGEMLGWIAGRPDYALVWELHPLAVRPADQHKGVGTRLVRALEARIAAAGGMTIMLGADDMDGRTSAAGRELYPDVLGAGKRLQAIAAHPVTFYQKMGFVICGLVPDANGFGRPDILMCKRVGNVGHNAGSH